MAQPKDAKRFETDVTLRDGSLAHIRPARPEDLALLVEFLQGLSTETRALRFLSGGIDPESEAAQMVPDTDRFALLALREERVIGHAMYIATEPGQAESSVVVADEYQRQGLGTILLGQLAEAAHDAGIAALEALVAPHNYRMIQVMRGLGYPTELHSEPGAIRVTFPTSPSPESIERFERREAEAAQAAMRAFFKPRGVAVVGASRKRGTIGGELFRNLLEAEFQGPVYPVNPNAEVVQSVPAYKSVLDPPGPVDLAIVVVPARAVVPVAKECAEKGVRALVVISAGFAEAGEEGTRLQQQLVEVCRKAGMRLIGPNCMGIVNTDPEVRLNAQFSTFVPQRGPIGFLSQSGALGIAIIDHANRLGLGMSTFVSVGNKADISGNDLIQYWEEDEQTEVMVLYLESFGNPRKFARIARRVARKKPIIAVKSGRSSAGFRASQSHTGALVSASDVTVDALFKQSGVIRTDSLGELFDVAGFLATQPIPQGDGVAIVTNAGGAGILAADACEAYGLKVPELAPETQRRLREFLPWEAGVRNPVDMIASAAAPDYGRAIRTVAEDPNVHALVVIFVPPIAVRPREVAHEILQAGRELEGKMPIVTNFLASHGLPDVLAEGGYRVPSYPFPEVAVRALARAAEYGRWLGTPEGEIPRFPDVRRDRAVALVARALETKGDERDRWLTPEETEALLECYGIPLVETERVATPEEAAKAAERLSGRVALKAVAPGLVHKTEAGAVELDLEPSQVEGAAREMVRELAEQGLSVEGFLVQEMAPAGVEMLVGVTHDPIFGPVVACGAGGVTVELVKDVAVRVTPLTDRVAQEMIRSLQTYELLEGYRGSPPADIQALEAVLLRVSTLVEDVLEVAELDLNPIIVLPDGQGVAVVDARVRVAEARPLLPLGAKKR